MGGISRVCCLSLRVKNIYLLVFLFNNKIVWVLGHRCCIHKNTHTPLLCSQVDSETHNVQFKSYLKITAEFSLYSCTQYFLDHIRHYLMVLFDSLERYGFCFCHISGIRRDFQSLRYSGKHIFFLI